jgi:DUF1680 family protein
MISVLALLLGAAAAAAPLTAVPIDSITLQGEAGNRIAATIENNFLALDLEKDFLRPFQARRDSGGFVGLGMLLDALAHAAAHSKDPRLIARKDEAVAAILATQEADGYIGIMKPQARLWKLWDIHEMSYLVLGLTANYRLFQHEPSRDGAVRLAQYMMQGWRSVEDPNPGGGEITVYMGITGMESAFLRLSEATGDPAYREFCITDRDLPAWDGPIVLGRWGQIQGHAYAYMSRCLAQLQLYQETGDPALLETSHQLIDFLLKEDGLAITGTCGQHECWHDTQEGAANLGETCATAYLIRWLDALLRIEDKPLYADMIERAIFNALFAAQSPDGRQIRYYSPFEGPREYFKGDTYCCPCNYRRIVAELPQMIYYTRENEVTVSQYAQSEAKFSLGDVPVQLRQDTAYPDAESINLTVHTDSPARFVLRLRIPAWCAAPKLTVAGEPMIDLQPGAFYAIDRVWEGNMAVQLELPMTAQLVRGRKAQEGRAAVMVGPRVFCLSREANPDLESVDLRQLTLKTESLRTTEDGEVPRCEVEAWRTTSWYPFSKPDYTLVLQPFPDPEGVATYFHVPNPKDERLVSDPIVTP